MSCKIANMKIKYILISIIAVLLGLIGYLLFRLDKVSKESFRTYQNQKYTDKDVVLEDGDSQCENCPRRNGNRDENGTPELVQGCIDDGCLAVENLEYPVGELSEEAKETLVKALEDEYKAHATYDAVVGKLGSVRPFIMIVRAEEQHISSLKSLFDKYGVEIPEDEYLGKVASPELLIEACQKGVEAETENIALYRDELLPKVTAYEDITAVFINLMNASKDSHLPAFQRCVE